MLRRTLAALLAALPCALAHAQELTHTAPWLGKTLELELTGAPPHAPCWLFASTSAAAVPTPFGLLELDLASAFPLFVGDADANGALHVAIDVPADAALAELPLHVQALHGDPAHAAGAALAPAKHLRLLGSRVYALLRHNSPSGTTRRLRSTRRRRWRGCSRSSSASPAGSRKPARCS